jgi:hypothetical protein
MKVMYFFAAAVLSTCFACTAQKTEPANQSAYPQDEASFLAAVKKAFADHDPDTLVALTCWDRVPVELKRSGKEQYLHDVAQDVDGITITPPEPGSPDLDWQRDGVTYHANLPVTKQLKITPAKGSTFGTGGTGVYPIGQKDGKLFLLEPVPND